MQRTNDWRRYAKNQYKRYRTHTPPAVYVSPRETRSEIVSRARQILERLRTRYQTSLPPFSPWETREMMREVAILRAAALARPPAPKGADIAWYVSIRDGARSGLLYGPLDTQGAALRALPIVRHFVHEQNYRDVAFAAFGTATFTGIEPPIGTLNGVLFEALNTDALPPTMSRTALAA